MSDWNFDPPSPRKYRFSVGEIAIIKHNGLPCEIMHVGGVFCHYCQCCHDYRVKLCTGGDFLYDDPDLKKLEPPANDLTETTSEDLEATV